MTGPTPMSLPSVFRTASLRVAAHCHDTPTLAEAGGSITPGGTNPSLPATPSRMPEKMLASRGGFAASPVVTQRDTSSLASSGMLTSSRTLLVWADNLLVSSSISSRDSDWELISWRWHWRKPSMSSRATCNSIRGRFTLNEVACWNL